MRRTALLLGVCAFLAVPCGAGATTTVAPAPVSLQGLACRQSVNPLNRMVGITATMHPIQGTERMAMRFELLERLPGGQFHEIFGGDLGHWRHPNPPRFGQQPGDTWTVNKPVVNLYAPARYRFRVSFRWVLWSGQRTTVSRLSPVCDEPLQGQSAG